VDRILEHRDAIPAFHESAPYQKKISDEKWKRFFFLYACIPAHRGPYTGLVRCHLGLLVPESRARCRIRVDDEYASWELDILRPLKQPARAVNGALLKLIGASPYIQDGVENYKRWEKKFDQMSH
jgi:hypothetical protein